MDVYLYIKQNMIEISETTSNKGLHLSSIDNALY